MEQIRVLLVEDNPGDARLMREAVREATGTQIVLTHVDTLARGLNRLNQSEFDVVMLDLSLPDADGLDTLLKTHAHVPSVPIVVLTGLDDEALAVRAVREGAQDYLVKGQVTGQLLVRAMRYATERKRAIEALQQSEQYYRSLIENALDIITVLDEQGRIRYASPSLERVLGFPQGELTDTNLYDLVHPEDRPGTEASLSTGSEHPGAAQSFECRVRHHNGTWRVLEAIGKRFEPNSQVEGYVLNSRDITERRRAEEQIRHANEFLRAVIERSPLSIYALDGAANVKSWNAAATRILGYDESEVIDHPAAVFFEDAVDAQKRVQQALAGHLAEGVESRCRRKDGTLVDVSIWNAELRDAAGAVIGIVEALADNTERKRLEEQFRQAQKMEAVGRLAGGVAHDFNNLLTVISGYCQMLLETTPNSDPAHADLQQIQKAAERATALTKQLLAFSRRQILQPKVVDLNSLIQDTIPMVQRLLGADIELILHLDEEGCRTRVDPGHLGQVLVNLVVNARDAMPDGGTLTIRTLQTGSDTQLPLTLRPGAYAVLEVEDTGSGMTEEVLRHLFEPFFTTKEKGRGTGLGLSTSYGIIKQNHGEILVRSEPGQGTAFSIYLPKVAEPVELPKVSTAERAAYRGSETILIAEDETGVRDVIVDMLNKRGYRVLAAPGGAEAMQILRSDPESVDLLITDIIMPRMGGKELAEHARKLRSDLPILFVSGYTEGTIRQDDLSPGTAFLHKPFTPDELSKQIRQMLQFARAETAKHN